VTDAHDHITRPRIFGSKDLAEGVHDCHSGKAQIQQDVCCSTGGQARRAEAQEEHPSALLNDFGDACQQPNVKHSLGV
jgi:hypothetical protein